ncbi:hypothetical protein BVRB_013160, partial [Beta vulgaris subsp. vulgaris]
GQSTQSFFTPFYLSQEIG